MVDGIHLFWGDQSDFRPHKKRLDLLIEELDQSANTGGKYITIATNLLPQSELWDVGGNSFTLREVHYHNLGMETISVTLVPYCWCMLLVRLLFTLSYCLESRLWPASFFLKKGCSLT